MDVFEAAGHHVACHREESRGQHRLNHDEFDQNYDDLDQNYHDEYNDHNDFDQNFMVMADFDDVNLCQESILDLIETNCLVVSSPVPSRNVQ